MTNLHGIHLRKKAVGLETPVWELDNANFLGATTTHSVVAAEADGFRAFKLQQTNSARTGYLEWLDPRIKQLS